MSNMFDVDEAHPPTHAELTGTNIFCSADSSSQCLITHESIQNVFFDDFCVCSIRHDSSFSIRALERGLHSLEILNNFRG